MKKFFFLEKTVFGFCLASSALCYCCADYHTVTLLSYSNVKTSYLYRNWKWQGLWLGLPALQKTKAKSKMRLVWYGVAGCWLSVSNQSKAKVTTRPHNSFVKSEHCWPPPQLKSTSSSQLGAANTTLYIIICRYTGRLHSVIKNDACCWSVIQAVNEIKPSVSSLTHSNHSSI